MANVITMGSDFTTDETAGTAPEEVKEAAPETAPDTEKETPSEPPAEQKPADEDAGIASVGEDTGDTKRQELERALRGIQEERTKLLREVSELRGQRRELKEVELKKVEQTLDDLKDMNPDDVSLVDRVLRAKGYVTQEEMRKSLYESVKNEELNKFLEKYPEYKSENDANNLNWNTLEREINKYRRPDDPRQIGEMLEWAHRDVARVSGGRDVSVQKRQIEVAGVGGGGVQRSSSRQKLDPQKRLVFEQGGWSEEEIQAIERRLSQ